jgi:hypothetical protein
LFVLRVRLVNYCKLILLAFFISLWIKKKEKNYGCLQFHDANSY